MSTSGGHVVRSCLVSTHISLFCSPSLFFLCLSLCFAHFSPTLPTPHHWVYDDALGVLCQNQWRYTCTTQTNVTMNQMAPGLGFKNSNKPHKVDRHISADEKHRILHLSCATTITIELPSNQRGRLALSSTNRTCRLCVQSNRTAVQRSGICSVMQMARSAVLCGVQDRPSTLGTMILICVQRKWPCLLRKNRVVPVTRAARRLKRVTRTADTRNRREERATPLLGSAVARTARKLWRKRSTQGRSSMQ